MTSECSRDIFVTIVLDCHAFIPNPVNSADNLRQDQLVKVAGHHVHSFEKIYLFEVMGSIEYSNGVNTPLNIFWENSDDFGDRTRVCHLVGVWSKPLGYNHL